jgi:dTDP-4-amino-4,6-dideoxygalactose transaminase
VRAADRRGLQQHLAGAQIGTGIHYPIPLHLQNAYEELGHKPDDFPVAERISKAILSLPMFPGLTATLQRRVAECMMAHPRFKLPRAMPAVTGR